MKNYILLFSVILYSLNTLNAQVELEVEERKFELLDNYEVSTGKNLDCTSMFKIYRNGNLLNNIELAYERKISNSFSLNLSLSGQRYVSFVRDIDPVQTDTIGGIPIIILGPGEFKTNYSLQTRLEGRYYIHQQEQIDNGFGNNLNGVYALIGIGTQVYTHIKPNNVWGGERNQSLYSYIGLGIQSRILKYGFLDFNLLATYRNKDFYLSPSINAGFAFSKNYKQLEFSSARCNILKCFEERNILVKIPFNGQIYVRYAPDFQYSYISLGPKAKFEHKLFKGLSMNHGVYFNTQWNLNFRTETRASKGNPSFAYSNNLRWYVFKKKRIANGKTADNLSGLYAQSHFTINMQKQFTLDVNDISQTILIAKSRGINYGLDVGYQTRLFKNFYIDVSAYLRKFEREFTYKHPDYSDRLHNFGNRIDVGTNLEFGFLF